MRWIEHDLNTLARSNFLNLLLQPLKEEISGLKFGRGAYGKGCTLRTGNVLAFKDSNVWQAFLVVTCFHSKEGLGVTGQQLQLPTYVLEQMDFDRRICFQFISI